MLQWDNPLQDLVSEGILTGFALVDHNSAACLSACGALQELWGDGEESTASCGGLWEQFHAAVAPDHVDVCGQHALVVHRTDSSVYAVARRKLVLVTAHYLPSGVLVTASSRPNWLQVVAPQVEAICDRLRQP